MAPIGAISPSIEYTLSKTISFGASSGAAASRRSRSARSLCLKIWTAASRAAQAVRRDGSAALDLAGVAMGRFDAFWEWRLKPWDVAAGTLIVREAGGTVSSIDGTPFDIAEGSILATNGKIHAELAAVIAGA